MDATTVVSDLMEKIDDVTMIESLIQMSDDYKFQILMSEFIDEINA